MPAIKATNLRFGHGWSPRSEIVTKLARQGSFLCPRELSMKPLTASNEMKSKWLPKSTTIWPKTCSNVLVPYSGQEEPL